MPVYMYHCNDCKFDFEARHSMSYDSQSCESCGSLNVHRIPSSLGSPKSTKGSPQQKSGSVVKDFIESAKKEVNAEKKALKSREM